MVNVVPQLQCCGKGQKGGMCVSRQQQSPDLMSPVDLGPLKREFLI